MQARLLKALVCALLSLAATCAPAQDVADLKYRQTVKPIFDRSCSGCHVAGGHAGGLRLGTYADLLQGGDDGSVVTFGDTSKSLISKAIHYQDPDLQMPPKGKLKDSDIAIIDRWIKESSHTLPFPPAVSPFAAAANPAEIAPTQVALVSAGSDTGPASPLLLAEREAFFEAKVRPVLVNECYTCHASAAKGGLRLDSRTALLQGGKDGAVIVAGYPEKSTLSSAVHYGDPRLQMPPYAPLKADEIRALDQWIRDGLTWTASATPAARETLTAAQRNFWSFQPVVRPKVPAVSSPWPANDIDRFVLAKLQEKKLTVGGDAEKRTLLRRVTYDLTGLPPTGAEATAFLADTSTTAYERVVDRLLASKAYGERWGRIWLDVVRYSDTTGGGGDFPVPQLAKYRNYVIDAFNEDKPYDRFIREQIAGDLIPGGSEEERWKRTIATGYLAGASTNDDAQILDAVDNLGYAFLGMTVACARCHDHKFDPIPTADYYAMAGVLKSTHFPHGGDDGVRYQTELVYRDPKAATRPEIVQFQAQLKPIAGAISAVLQLPGTYDDLLPQLERRRMNLYARAPAFPESAYAVSEGKPLQAQIQLHGDPKNLGGEVPRGTLQILGGGPMPPEAKGSGRLELADWIASKNNPTTARVLVNRLWQAHFGRGIVPTPNNLGTRGVPPSDQKLLDFLASEFVDKGWSIKAMQREILLSHTYRLSSDDLPANAEIDPDNVFLWRHTRTRLDAEEIRDTLLADSGLLDRSVPGPHPFPPQSEWNWEEQNPFKPDVTQYENDHRAVYMMVQRSVKHPYMTLFDGADANVSTDQRSSSLTPLQALYFMNSTFPKRCADHLAEQLDVLPDPQARLDAAFLTIFNRPPSALERERTQHFLTQLAAKLTATGQTSQAVSREAFAHLLQAMFSSNEFMFID